MPIDSDGKESEWNEATFKSKRLHEIQEFINYCKVNLRQIVNGAPGYVAWKDGVDLLFMEGQSKYSSAEKGEVIRLLKIAEWKIKNDSPYKLIISNGICGSKRKHSFDEKKFDELYEILYTIEIKVKEYNDKHGLTTKNKGAAGMF